MDRSTPPLATISGVLTPESATLVQVIAHGIDRQIGSARVTMPGFGKDFTDAQIAVVANYVRSDIAGVAGGLDETKVRNLLDGVTETPWLIRNTEALAFAAIAAALIIVLALLWLLLRRRQRPA